MYNQLTLLIMNHGCNLIVPPFNIFQARFKEFGDVGLSSTLKVYKVFIKVSQGSWLKRKLCLGPALVIINCSPLSTLFFCVSLFPRAFGYNIWCIDQETHHFEETIPIWGSSEASWFRSSRGWESSRPSGKIQFLDTWTLHVKWKWMAAGELSTQVRKFPTLQGEREGLINHLRWSRGCTDCKYHKGGSVCTILG